MINTLNRQQLSMPLAENNRLSPEVPTVTYTESIKSFAVKTVDVATAVMPVIFLLAAFTLEGYYPQYNRIESTVSDLVWAPQGWIMTVVFAAFGLVLMSVSIRLCLRNTKNKLFKMGIVLVFLIGIGFIIIALFPTKAPGAAQTIETFLHQQTARGLSVAFPLACLCLACSFKNDSDWQLVRISSLISCGLGFCLAMTGAGVILAGASWIGAIERAIIANGFIWVEVLGISLLYPRFASGIIERLIHASGTQAIIARLLPEPVVGRVCYVEKRTDNRFSMN
jgi:hypothetical protein